GAICEGGGGAVWVERESARAGAGYRAEPGETGIRRAIRADSGGGCDARDEGLEGEREARAEIASARRGGGAAGGNGESTIHRPDLRVDGRMVAVPGQGDAGGAPAGECAGVDQAAGSERVCASGGVDEARGGRDSVEAGGGCGADVG